MTQGLRSDSLAGRDDMLIAICKLCVETKPLIRSHLVPSGVYSLCCDSTHTHIFINSRVVMHSSREVQDYLLCRECDNSLNHHGESWLIPKLARQDGSFPLLDILEKISPIEKDGESVAFVVANNPEINIEKLTHVALGVFWKASVHSWSGTKKESLIDLGPYSDKLRRFLTHESLYPDNVALAAPQSSGEPNFRTFES